MEIVKALNILDNMCKENGIGSDEWQAVLTVKQIVGLFTEVDSFEETLNEYMENHWEGDFDDVDAAKEYLSYPSYEDMDDEDIIDEANEAQTYYFTSNEADVYEKLDKVLEIYEG